jgi:hypothetical protein
MDATVAPDAPDDASNEGAADAADGMVIVTSCGQTVVVSPGPFGSCYARCFPLEAGALDSIDAGDSGVLSRTQCTPICGAGSWFSCTPFVDAGASIVSCQPDCTGRRPGGLQAAEPARGSPLGAYFAEMARLEAASVDAFRQLRRELIAQRAPRRLIRETERAARDEVRHARMTRALARRYGGVATAPEVEAGPARSLEAIALENAVEGCVREAFGALVASWQALAARDPVIRAAMARIARDETRHAALAFAIDGWARGRMDRTARARVDQSRQQAIESLAARAPDAPAALRAALGLPTRAQTLVLIEQMGKLAA